MIVRAGDIGKEDEESIVLEPLDEPGEVPVPSAPAIPPAREPVPA